MANRPIQEKTVEKETAGKLPAFHDCTAVQKLVYVIAVVFALVSLYYGFFPTPSIIQLAVHLLFAAFLIFLIFRPQSRAGMAKDLIFKVPHFLFLGLSVFAILHLLVDYEEVVGSVGNLSTLTLASGGILTVSVLYMAQRTLGWPLPIIAIAFILYALFGRQLPGGLQHGGYSLEQIISLLYITQDGIFGAALSASATLVIFFLIFSAFYEKAGGGNLVLQLANAGFGWLRGGPAKVSVVASGLFGSISGSAIANVVSTGALTIPMMKRTNFRPHFAGAVEAVSSTGGQLAPPIMGAAAFVMAEILGVPYPEIIIAAVIPAILYYLAVFIMVHLEAAKLNLRGVRREELPSLKRVLADYGSMLIPLLALIYMLVFMGYSPARAALFAVGFTIVVSLFRRTTRLGIENVFESLRNAATGVLQVAAATACAGIILGVFTLTGLGLKLSYTLIDLSGGSTLVLLIFTALVSIILGMGMPTVGAYLVLAIVVAPVLIRAGIEPLAAHLFIFYFGIMSMVTPPVALASFTAAGLAEASMSKTGWAATRLAVSGFIVPFLFVYDSGLLLEGSVTGILSTTVTAAVGIAFLSIALTRYLLTSVTRLEQLLLIAGALTLIHPGMITDAIGIVLGAVGIALHIVRSRKGIADESSEDAGKEEPSMIAEERNSRQ